MVTCVRLATFARLISARHVVRLRRGGRGDAIAEKDSRSEHPAIKRAGRWTVDLTWEQTGHEEVVAPGHPQAP
jgi:hypothetical protein